MTEQRALNREAEAKGILEHPLFQEAITEVRQHFHRKAVDARSEKNAYLAARGLEACDTFIDLFEKCLKEGDLARSGFWRR